MKWPPRNYVESTILLITTYALIGHGVFHYPPGKPRIRFSIFYTISLTIGFTIVLYYTLTYAFAFTYDAVEEKLFFYMLYWQIFIVNCTTAISWFHYKKRDRIVKRITAIDETLRELGADCQYKNTFRRIVGAIVLQTILIFAINIADMIWLEDRMTALEMIWVNLVFHYPFHVSSFGLLNFSMVVRTIITRFTLTNEILETITNQESTENYTRPESVDSHKCLVQIIKQVHLELCDISRDLNETYGVQIILQLAEYFLLLTGLVYDLYLNFMLTGETKRDLKRNILIVWFVVYFGKVVMVNYLCDKAVGEANRTTEIIHKSNALYDETEFKDEIKQFALQTMQNPLSFNPAGFFTLGNRFVKSMLATITTYTVILIEMNIINKI